MSRVRKEADFDILQALGSDTLTPQELAKRMNEPVWSLTDQQRRALWHLISMGTVELTPDRKLRVV